MGKVAAGFGFAYIIVLIFAIIGWVMNLFHCLAYIGGGNVDDSTPEVIVRIVGIFLLVPGAIAGYF